MSAHRPDAIGVDQEEEPEHRPHDRVGGAGQLGAEKNEAVVWEEMKWFKEVGYRHECEQDREDRESCSARFSCHRVFLPWFPSRFAARAFALSGIPTQNLFLLPTLIFPFFAITNKMT